MPLTLLNFITQNVLVTIFENMQNYLVQFAVFKQSFLGSLSKDIFEQIASSRRQCTFCILGQWFCPNVQANGFYKVRHVTLQIW